MTQPQTASEHFAWAVDRAMECVDRMDCVATRFHDRKPGPAFVAMYAEEFRRHRDCDPTCLRQKHAVTQLIALGVDPELVA